MSPVKFFFSISVCVLITACSIDSITEDYSTLKESDVVTTALAKTETNFSVSIETLSKYLKLFHKSKVIEKVEPVIKREDTLAFYVLFSNNSGWLLVSGDKRVPPLLASSESGTLSLSDTDNPAIQSLSVIIDNVKNIKDTHNNRNHSIWELCSPKKYDNLKNTQTKAMRGLAVGMWLPMDTTIRQVSQQSPKLTNSNWHQNSPWNRYTPKRNDTNCVVGCGPVAVGQLIYKYYASNPGQNPIPSTMTYSADGEQTYYSHFTTTAWASLVANEQVVINDDDTTALFLSWIGSSTQMDADYGLSSTDTQWGDHTRVLNNYFYYRNGFSVHENNNEEKNQFCDTVASSILAGSPVLCASNINDHSFLIDKCSVNETQYVVRYVFDPYHVVTEEEYYNNPSWMFDWPGPTYGYDPDKDTAEFEIISPLINNLSIQMNWGFGPNYNSINYLLRSRTYSYYDGSPTISDFIVLSWVVNNETFGGIYHWAHHFIRKN